MRRDRTEVWVYALAVTLLATITVTRCAPDSGRVDPAVLDASQPIADPVPYEGWWKNRPQ